MASSEPRAACTTQPKYVRPCFAFFTASALTPGGSALSPEPPRHETWLFEAVTLAAAVAPQAYLADRFLDAASPGVAMTRKYLISGDRIQACQRFDRLGGVRGERRDLRAARPRCHRVGCECVAHEQGATRCDVQGGAAGSVAGRQD